MLDLHKTRIYCQFKFDLKNCEINESADSLMSTQLYRVDAPACGLATRNPGSAPGLLFSVIDRVFQLIIEYFKYLIEELIIVFICLEHFFGSSKQQQNNRPCESS